MGNSTIKMENCAFVRMIQINRPEVNNKLSIACMKELKKELEHASQGDTCRAVVLYGNSEWFCAGGDLGDYRRKSIQEIKEFGDAFISLHLTMQSCSRPIIAAVEGKAYGGGCSLVEACDLAVASEDAEFAVPEMRNGLAPAMGFSGLFANLGKKQAMAMGLLGEKLSAEKAKELGLVNAVVKAEEVLSYAIKMAEQFQNFDPMAVNLFKEMYADMGQRAYENRLRIGQAMMVALFKAKGEEYEII